MNSQRNFIHVSLCEGPLPSLEPIHTPGAGAWICFDGVVRPTEGEFPIAGLTYEAYRPMAEKQLQSLGAELAKLYGLIAIRVEHSVGWVPAGACSFRLQVSAPRRKEAFAAMQEFIDRMKRDVPIWKSVQPDVPHKT